MKDAIHNECYQLTPQTTQLWPKPSQFNALLDKLDVQITAK